MDSERTGVPKAVPLAQTGNLRVQISGRESQRRSQRRPGPALVALAVAVGVATGSYGIASAASGSRT